MKSGKLDILSGISSDSQESSFMNAALSTHRDGLCVSIAVFPNFPDSVDTKDPASVEAYFRSTLASLQSLGYDVEIQMGPDSDEDDGENEEDDEDGEDGEDGEGE